MIADLIDIEGRLKSKKAVLNILDPALDTSSSSGRLMFNIFGSVAQFEREIMLERQRIGMAKAKADGKCMGRKPTAFAHAELVRKYADEGLNPTDIAKKVGIGRASVYRILGAKQAHDIKMKDRLSRWGSRETAKGWIMGRRNRHGRSRAHLREVSEDFERDWRDERDEVNVEEIADNRPSDSYIALQAEAETLRTDLQAASALPGISPGF